MINKVLIESDNVLAVSNDLMNKILNTNIKNIKNKTLIHLNAVDINKFKEIPHKNKEKPTVIFGWLIDRKNVNSLLDAKKQSNKCN